MRGELQIVKLSNSFYLNMTNVLFIEYNQQFDNVTVHFVVPEWISGWQAQTAHYQHTIYDKEQVDLIRHYLASVDGDGSV